MKVCCTCHEEKEKSEFNRGQDRCRACCKVWYDLNKPLHIKNTQERTKKVRDKAVQAVYDYLLAHPCVDCGESDPIVLEFDHVRGKKVKDVSEMIRSAYSVDTIFREIEKCDVRCANCHRRRTAYQFSWSMTKLQQNMPL